LTAEQCPDAQAERRDFGVFDYEHPDRCLIVRVDFYPLDSYKRQAGGDHQFPPRFMVRKVQLMRPGADEGLYALLAQYLDLRGDRREPIARPRAPTPGGPAAPEPQAPASPAECTSTCRAPR
jgi:hypothetical protein